MWSPPPPSPPTAEGASVSRLPDSSRRLRTAGRSPGGNVARTPAGRLHGRLRGPLGPTPDVGHTSPAASCGDWRCNHQPGNTAIKPEMRLRVSGTTGPSPARVPAGPGLIRPGSDPGPGGYIGPAPTRTSRAPRTGRADWGPCGRAAAPLASLDAASSSWALQTGRRVRYCTCK